MPLILMLLFFLFSICNGQESDQSPFLGKQGKVVEHTDWPGAYSNVVAVTYDFTQEKSGDVVVGQRLHKGVFATSKALTKDQQATLFSGITGKHTPWKPAASYMPHHGFIFYDEKGVITGSISICFSCQVYHLSPRGEVSLRWDWPSLEKLFKDLDMPFAKNYTEAYRNSKLANADTSQIKQKAESNKKAEPKPDGKSK